MTTTERTLPYDLSRREGFLALAAFTVFRDMSDGELDKMTIKRLCALIGCRYNTNNIHRIRVALRNLSGAGWIKYSEKSEDDRRWISIKLTR